MTTLNLRRNFTKRPVPSLAKLVALRLAQKRIAQRLATDWGWRKPVVFEPGMHVLVKEVPEWGEGVIERALGAPGPDESSRGVDGCATLYSIDFPDGNRLLRSDQLKRAQRKPWDASKHPRGHEGNPGEFSKVNVKQLPKPDKLTIDRSERAKAAHFMVDREIQRYAEQHNEPQVAKALGGVSFPDSEAVDIVVAGPTGAVQVGIELKTIVSNKAQKITMKESAMKRKRTWQRKNKARIWTVVLDDTLVYNAKGPGRHDFSKRVIYAKKGFGSFRIKTIQRIESMQELKVLLNSLRRAQDYGWRKPLHAFYVVQAFAEREGRGQPYRWVAETRKQLQAVDLQSAVREATAVDELCASFQHDCPDEPPAPPEDFFTEEFRTDQVAIMRSTSEGHLVGVGGDLIQLLKDFRNYVQTHEPNP